jgi:hypothetical protein
MNTSYPLRILLLALGLLGGLAKARGATEEIKPDPQGAAVHETAAGIDEKGYVSIGGIQQWVTIKGRNRANPVVLFVHGGPGNPMSQYAETLYKAWEGDFTIVHWDQRKRSAGDLVGVGAERW